MLCLHEKSVFLKICQYFGSDFSKNTDKSVYLEAMTVQAAALVACPSVGVEL